MSALWIRRAAPLALAVAAAVGLAACGGSSSPSSSNSGGGTGGGSTVANTVPISVNSGPNANYVNGVYVTVHVCAAGSTTDCQDIPDVLVDTGSTGLRLVGSLVTVSLVNNVNSSGEPIGECEQFADGTYLWGTVAPANITLAGETAADVPVQILKDGTSGFVSAPSACTNSGALTESDTVAALGANGILGIGVFNHDCGANCAGTPAPAGFYYSCPNTGCTNPATVALANQVQNPIGLFPQDNNGEVITLPAVPDSSIASSGAPSVQGTLTFGIGTQSDNQLGSATVLAGASDGTVATQYPASSTGTVYGSSTACPSCGTVFDTGSNAIYFLDSSNLPSMPTCGDYTGFYCPGAGVVSFTAVNGSTVANGTKSATWNVANADTLFADNPNNWVFDNLAGPDSGAFDFGLPFFLGKKVFIGLNGTSAGSYTGPFFAY